MTSALKRVVNFVSGRYFFTEKRIMQNNTQNWIRKRLYLISNLLTFVNFCLKVFFMFHNFAQIELKFAEDRFYSNTNKRSVGVFGFQPGKIYIASSLFRDRITLKSPSFFIPDVRFHSILGPHYWLIWSMLSNLHIYTHKLLENRTIKILVIITLYR